MGDINVYRQLRTLWHLAAGSGKKGIPCGIGFTRLKIGDEARVMPGPPNRIRSKPSIQGEVLTQLDPGTAVRIVDGPVCRDGYVFWRVEHATIPGGSGWTAEGDGKEYYLEPTSGADANN